MSLWIVVVFNPPSQFPGVSILVLLDVPLDPVHRPITCTSVEHVSILVLLDVPLDQVIRAFSSNALFEFQSLFCWMSLWIQLSHPWVGRNRNRFNPCFAGCPSGSHDDWRRCSLDAVVSILVLLDVPLDPIRQDRVSLRYSVSILVLLDVPLDLHLAPRVVCAV